MTYNPSGSASLARFTSDGVRSFDQADIDNSTAATAAQVVDNAAQEAWEVLTATNKAVFAKKKREFAAAEAAAAAALERLKISNHEVIEAMMRENEKNEEVARKNFEGARRVTLQTAEVHLRCEFESWVRERMRLTSSMQCCSMSSIRNLF
jgi:hypothetical protein